MTLNDSTIDISVERFDKDIMSKQAEGGKSPPAHFNMGTQESDQIPLGQRTATTFIIPEQNYLDRIPV